MSSILSSLFGRGRSGGGSDEGSSGSRDGFVVVGPGRGGTSGVAGAAVGSAGGAGSAGDALSLSTAGQYSRYGSQLSGQISFTTTLTAGATPESATTRAPLDISVALDISGSMSGTKLDLCKSTLLTLLNELGPGDRLSLTTFGDEAVVLTPMTFLSESSKREMIRTIKSINTKGCTNLSGGLSCALQETMSVRPNPGAVRSVLLLTDGHANRGVSNAQGIIDLLSGCLGTETDISINTFGYGEDHNAALLKSLSDSVSQTAGSYYFISNGDDVSSAFGDCLGGLMSVVAQNIRLTLTGSDESMTVRHNKAKKQADGSFLVQLGDMFSEEAKDIVITFTAEKNSTKPIRITATCSYIDTLNNRPASTQVVSFSTERPEGNSISDTNVNVALQVMRMDVTAAMSKANGLARVNISAARSVVTDALQEITRVRSGMSLTSEQEAIVTTLTSDLNDCLEGMQTFELYAQRGSKTMMSKMQTHLNQRCNESSEESLNLYKGSMKAKFASRFKSKF